MSTFAKHYPIIHRLLGPELQHLPDQLLRMKLSSNEPSEAAIDEKLSKILESHPASEISCRFLPGNAGYQLADLEWGLNRIEEQLGPDAVDEAFATKLRGNKQFYDTLAEVGVAAACSIIGTLEALEHPTGVGTKDCDVRCRIDGVALNVEVRAFKDEKTVTEAVHDIDEETGMRTSSFTRSSLSQKDARDAGLPHMQSPGTINSVYTNIRGNIKAKANKFLPGELNVVAFLPVGATPGSLKADEALFGGIGTFFDKTSKEIVDERIANNGLFCNDGVSQLNGVIYAYLTSLFRCIRDSEQVSDNRIFVNPYAVAEFDRGILVKLSEIFSATVLPTDFLDDKKRVDI